MTAINVKLSPILRQRNTIARSFCNRIVHQVPLSNVRPRLLQIEYSGERWRLFGNYIRRRRLHPAMVSARFFATKKTSDRDQSKYVKSFSRL